MAKSPLDALVPGYGNWSGGTAPSQVGGSTGDLSGMMGGFAPTNFAPTGQPPGATTVGNLTFSNPGDQEKLLDWLFRGGATGQGGSAVGNTLYNFAQGKLPKSMVDWITQSTDDQFGKMGARFGTDLGTAVSRGLAQASESKALDAMHELFGLGGTTAGFQFTRGENALERALKEWQTRQQTDMNSELLKILLGG
jgi:hypothetical protein